MKLHTTAQIARWGGALAFAALAAGCGATDVAPVVCGEGTREIQGICVPDPQGSSSPEGAAHETTSPPTTLPSTTTAPPPDAGIELARIVNSGNTIFSSGAREHVCGPLAFVATPREQRLLAWTGTQWDTAIRVPDSFELSGEKVADFLMGDLTGDGRAEIVIRWAPQFTMREVGAVLRAATAGCRWEWQELTDSCSNRRLYEGLGIERDGSLIGSGWSGACSPRETVRFRWFPEINSLVARPYDSSTQMCGFYDESRIDLPIITCNRNWAVQMFQEGLRASGFNVNPDGYFGPGTQIAVLGYQQRLGLEMTGHIDADTWSSMYPVDWENGFPDFDNDGVSSPREIAHWSGG